jgi:hypothetical protein
MAESVTRVAWMDLGQSVLTYPQVVVQWLTLDLACVAPLAQQRLLLTLPVNRGCVWRDACCGGHYVACLMTRRRRRRLSEGGAWRRKTAELDSHLAMMSSADNDVVDNCTVVLRGQSAGGGCNLTACRALANGRPVVARGRVNAVRGNQLGTVHSRCGLGAVKCTSSPWLSSTTLRQRRCYHSSVERHPGLVQLGQLHPNHAIGSICCGFTTARYIPVIYPNSAKNSQCYAEKCNVRRRVPPAGPECGRLWSQSVPTNFHAEGSKSPHKQTASVPAAVKAPLPFTFTRNVHLQLAMGHSSSQPVPSYSSPLPATPPPNSGTLQLPATATLAHRRVAPLCA